jgi:asparagine synthase (glutamine-hydrolysing)
MDTDTGMCGFIGQLTYDAASDRGADSATLHRLSELAARRGPDGEGFWSDERRFAVGFRRLAILDPSAAGHQPMRSADGRYVLVYNGALYNFPALRQELEGAGQRFHSSGDAEVVLAALAHWGTAALARFNGMFALAFYDTEARRLTLARDHAGMKPLYCLLTSDGVAFASQYDQLMSHPWSRSRRPSDDAVGLYLRLGYIPAPYAFLEGSQALEPGTWLRIDTDGVIERGRSFTFPQQRTPDLAGAEAADAVAAAVEAAVRRHLLADVPVGTFLSGGIDSPLITATAYATDRPPLRAFTLGTAGDAHDESAAAATYAREIGIGHQLAHLTALQAPAMIDDVVAACGEPFADYSLFPTLALSRVAREQVKVVLCGDGGDELFWGYTGRFSALLGRLDGSARARVPLGRLLDGGEASDLRWPRTIGDLHRLNHLHGTEGWLQRIFPELPPWPADFTRFVYDGREVDATAQWLRWNEFTGYLTMVLCKVDRATMFHGIEARAPLLDREVIDVALRIDWRTCLDPQRRVGKLPLRHALARRVARQTAAKRGFTVPMDEWLRGPLRALFEETVVPRRELAGLSVDPAAVRDVFDRHLSRRHDYSWLLWVLLSLALWEDRHWRPAAAYGQR